VARHGRAPNDVVSIVTATPDPSAGSDAPRSRTLAALFGLLYFSEGAPIGFLWWAMPTLLRDQGLELSAVTSLTAALVVPWTLKFLWAPVIDLWRGPKWSRRHWLVAAQLGMGLSLVPLVFLDPADHFATWCALLLTHAFFAATQDVAIDGLAVTVVPAESRGLVNGAMQAGMLLGRSLFGGVSILVATRWGLAAVFSALLVAIWCSLLVVRYSTTLRRAPAAPSAGERRLIGREIVGMFGRATTWLALGFALLAGAGFESAGALAGPYLLDHGVEKDTIGLFLALPVTAAMLVGGLAGGRIADRVRREWAVAAFCTATAGFVLVLAALPHDAAAPVRLGCLAGLYFAIGLFTAASYALFMDLACPVAGGTQFTLFMAATNGCEAWAAWCGGRWAESSGYGVAFAAMAGISLAGAALLVPLARRREAAPPG